MLKRNNLNTRYHKILMTLLMLLLWVPAFAGDTKIVDTKIVHTTDSNGQHIEKRIVKKVRTRVIIDFEEASIEGKVKKPSAAYILHGADLNLKHLYRIKNNQRRRIYSSYEYLR